MPAVPYLPSCFVRDDDLVGPLRYTLPAGIHLPAKTRASVSMPMETLLHFQGVETGGGAGARSQQENRIVVGKITLTVFM